VTADEGDLLRSLGFVAEGLLRGACSAALGGFADQTIWSMLRADWLTNALPRPERGVASGQSADPTPGSPEVDPRDGLPAWSAASPVLAGPRVTLREIEEGDGDVLLRLLDPAEIERCIEPPPTTPEMFRHYIAWARRQRTRARAVGFAIVAGDSPDPVGLLQVRSVGPDFGVAEWGIVLAPAWRGTGLFEDVLSLIASFVFDTLGVHRLEARTSHFNAAVTATLRRMGAMKEASLRASFPAHGEYQDDELWAVTDREWRRRTGKGGAAA